MNLHHANRVFARNRKRVSPAFDDHDAGDQPWIQIMLLRTSNNGLRQPFQVSTRNLVGCEESFNRANYRTANLYNLVLNNGFLFRERGSLIDGIDRLARLGKSQKHNHRKEHQAE